MTSSRIIPGLVISATLGVAAPLTAQPAGFSYPPARAATVVDTLHGVPIADPYRWLEDTEAPDTRSWIDAQNALTFGYLNGLPSRSGLKDRLTELWNYERFGLPVIRRGHYFYFRNSGLQNQPVLYVQKGRDNEPRELLDANTLSADGTVALTSIAASDNARYVGYTVSASGSDWQEIRVRDVRSGRDLPDTLKWVKFSTIAWTADGKGFFYSRYDAPANENVLLSVTKHHKLYYHRLGTPQSADELIYERPDEPEWSFNADVTDDGQFAVIYVSQGADRRNRIYLIDLGNPRRPMVTNPVVRLLDDFDAAYRVIDNVRSSFYVETDQGAPRGRVVAIDLNARQREHWRTVIPEGPDVLTNVAFVGERLIAHYLKDARSVMRLYTPAGTSLGELALPGIGTVDGISGRRSDREAFYSFTSFLSPTTIHRYDVAKGESEVFRQPTVNFDASRFETRQVFYTSSDGTRVPMFITARKDVVLDGTNPTLLYGYGGFNISLTPSFSVKTLVWLEHGGVYAQPNLRGGGEYGKEWHEAGTRGRKQSVFDDFIAAAEYLIAQRYTSPAKLAIEGGSNGGLLVGAVMTQRPELFGVALPDVGVMDMLRFHKFTIGWAWTSDYGSPDDSADFEVLRRYSPLHNLEQGTRYPATLITTADHDDRVVPGHSFKFAAALQAAHGGSTPVMIRIETKAGHGAGKPTDKQIELAADQLAFALHHLEAASRASP